jgi:hypothetical protein
MANQTKTNPRRYDTGGIAISTSPIRILEMVWVDPDSDGHSLVITDVASGVTLIERTAKASTDKIVLNVPTVYPRIYLDTIQSGTLEVTVA